MNFSTQLWISAAFMAALMILLWVVQWRQRNATLVDVGWAGGLGLVALWYAATGLGPAERRWFVGGLAALWSFRLAGYLLWHRGLGQPEDGRYQALRRRWGTRAQPYFLLFYLFQAGLVVLFSLPFWAAMAVPAPLMRAWDVVGLGIWAMAVMGETLADRQLARYRARPEHQGKVCQDGLWRYSRHPNYFFEWLHWWTYVALAVGSPWWWLTLLGPVLMLLFLLFVTGIPATEAHLLASRGDAYRDYQRTTSAFIPWFPKGATPRR